MRFYRREPLNSQGWKEGVPLKITYICLKKVKLVSAWAYYT